MSNHFISEMNSHSKSDSPDQPLEGFKDLTPNKRIDAIKSLLNDTGRSDNSTSYETQTGNLGGLHYLWIRGTRSKVIGVSFAAGPVFDTGTIIDRTQLKMHLNIAPEQILPAIQLLAELQDELYGEPDADTGFQMKTFVFKVALDDRVFNNNYSAQEGKPPRIVIYPSSAGLYPNLKNREIFDEVYLKSLINLIDKRLSKLDVWIDPLYRARYSKKFESLSLADGRLEVVMGSTAIEGDNSGR